MEFSGQSFKNLQIGDKIIHIVLSRNNDLHYWNFEGYYYEIISLSKVITSWWQDMNNLINWLYVFEMLTR